jgi:hypothetical protein
MNFWKLKPNESHNKSDSSESSGGPVLKLELGMKKNKTTMINSRSNKSSLIPTKEVNNSDDLSFLGDSM